MSKAQVSKQPVEVQPANIGGINEAEVSFPLGVTILTQLAIALASYLVHEFHEFPLIVLNSLKALDSNRTAALVEYFSEYAEYLIAVLLPEDAVEFHESHQRIMAI